jgi:hypothetical protein
MKKPLETLSWQNFNSKATKLAVGIPEHRFSKGQGKPLRGPGCPRVPLNQFPFLESRLVKRAGLGDGWPEFQFFIFFVSDSGIDVNTKIEIKKT